MDVKWIWAACILPDLPWLAQRAVRAVLPGVNSYDLRLYAAVQSSLFTTLFIAAGLAILARRPVLVFAVLTFGSVLHLLLDATQIKWAHGSLLFAPFSWVPINFELFWPEDWPSYAMTSLGIVVLVWIIWHERPNGFWPLNIGVHRCLCSIALFVAYVLSPTAFMGAAAEANLHFTTTLREIGARSNSAIEVDRSAVEWRENQPVLIMSMGPELNLDGTVPADARLVSVRGSFHDAQTITIQALHVHPKGQRDLLSYIGIGVILGWWGAALLRCRTN